MKKPILHFQAGLPRSGATRLAAILRQNPRFHADVMSPVEGLCAAALNAMSGSSETSFLMDDAARPRVLRGIFESYYAGKNVVFDSNRWWCSHANMIAELFPAAKIICLVRDVRWVMDSLERATLRNPFHLSSLAGYRSGTTVYDRIRSAASGAGSVGGPLNGLKEAYAGPFSDRLIIIRYEDFARDPARIVGALYDVLQLKRFKHDFYNAPFSSPEFDRFLHTPGLHTVKPGVTCSEREPAESVLPPDLFNSFANDLYWLKSTPSKAEVLT